MPKESGDILNSSKNQRQGTSDQLKNSAYKPLKEIYQYEQGNDGDLEKDLETFSKGENVPSEASFPLLIFLVALIKDILDAFTGGVFSFIFSLLFGFVLWLWWFNKTSFIKKYIRKWVIKRVIFFIVGDSIPFAAVLVPSSLLIVLWHYREKKIVKAFKFALLIYNTAAKASAQQAKATKARQSNTVDLTAAA